MLKYFIIPIETNSSVFKINCCIKQQGEKIMKKTNKILIFIIAVTFLFLFGCQSNNSDIEALKKENEQLKQQVEELLTTSDTTADTTAAYVSTSEYEVKFEEDDSPMTFGNSEHIAEIKNASIVFSPEQSQYLLLINFHYTNKSNDSSNFINDSYCNVIAYQDGIELDSPTFTSEKNIYDKSSAFTRIKNAEIDTQWVFVLRNTESSIELELGSDYYSSKITKKIVISKK